MPRKAVERSGGVACPECGVFDAARVLYVKKPRGYVTRRRRCICGKRFTTRESIPGAALNSIAIAQIEKTYGSLPDRNSIRPSESLTVDPSNPKNER